jgi:DNA topoisomerase I
MAVREIDCNGPGMRRRRAGKGFTYLDEDGERITDEEVVDRIRALAIPPAWEDVWICSDPNGHIQATGLDAKGRRQYRYHDEWRAARDREKHDRVLRFAKRLPGLRAQVAEDIARPGMPRERVLACAVRLLELGFFRIGGETYAEENDTYGLATLRKGHVRVRADALEFDYEAKSGQQRLCQVVDPEVRAVIVTLRRRRSPADAELLAYKEGREWIDLRSSDINDYIQSHIGDDFTAKDFRTWVGTVLAAVGLAGHEAPESETQAKRVVAGVVRDVAEHLGNTPAVARSAYIDPRVVERFEADDTVADVLEDIDLEDLEQGIPEELEEAVLGLIDRARRRRVKGRRAARPPGDSAPRRAASATPAA